MSRPNYRVVISFDADRKTYTARVPELQHCTAEGATRAEAIAQVEQELDAILANMAGQGKSPPHAIDDSPLGGEFSVKVSRGLHRELLWQAANEGVDIAQLAGEMLSSALDSRRNARPRRPQYEGQPQDNRGGSQDNRRPYEGGDRRRGGGQQGGRFPALLDDRAHFIEYVRNLEGDARRGPGPGPRDDRRGGGGPDRGRRPNQPPQGRDRGRPNPPSEGGGGDHGAPSGNSERGS